MCNSIVLTCPVRPALVVVKLTSAIMEDASGGNSKLGLRVVMNSLEVHWNLLKNRQHKVNEEYHMFSLSSTFN